jgi:aryl-alcohol dehydrogenase-like predicted oxidoreductase
MQKRKIGNTAIEVTNLCFGGNVFGWTVDEKTSFELLDAFTGEGFNFIDTADVYSRWASGLGGESETIIGKWMRQRGNRDKIILATKAGMDMGQGRTDVSRKYILKAAEDSLKRLQTDYIDLFQTHKDDEATPVEEALEAYAQLIKEGKVRAIGASNFSPARLKAALIASASKNLPRYECLQPLYNLCDRALFENELRDICLNNNISVIPYFSLAAGFLSGKYRSESDLFKSVRGARVKMYMNEGGLNVLKTLDQLCEKCQAPMSAIALAWLAAQPAVTAPIASATSLTQLRDMMKCSTVKLEAEDMVLLGKISSGISSQLSQ